jgi:MFS family permease
MVYGKENVAGAFEQVGALTATLVGSQAVMTVLWGLIGDRKGHKVVLCGAAFSMGLAIAVAWIASSPAWLWVAFALLGVSVSADSVSRMNIILEFCDPEDRPTYIGMTNTLLAPARALAPIIGGWLATWAGYRGMFVVGLLVSILGSALLALWVREPRRVQSGAADR